MDGGTSWATVHAGTKSRTQPSNFAFALAFSLPAPPGPGSPGAVSLRPEPHTLCPKPPGLARGTPATSSGKAACSPLLLHELNRLKQPGLAAVWTPCARGPGGPGAPAGRRPGLACPSLLARPAGTTLPAGLQLTCGFPSSLGLPPISQMRTPRLKERRVSDPELPLWATVVLTLSPPLGRHTLPASCLC